jgi:hypothetical protein
MGPSVINSNDLETQTPGDDTPPGRRNVCFDPFLKVVLVPSRGEYKCAGLCPILWWTSSDFFSFQQSAHSEVRLLSAFENIGGREARKKLYQPSHVANADLEVLENMCATTDDYYLSDEEKDDMSDSDDAYDSLRQSSESDHDREFSHPGSSPRIIIKTSFHKVSSLDCISASLRQSELLASETYSPPTSNKENEANSPLISYKEIDELGEDSHLQLCVPLTQPRMLNTECGSSGRSRRSKKQMSSTSIALCSTFLLIAFVFIDRYGPSYFSKVS